MIWIPGVITGDRPFHIPVARCVMYEEGENNDDDGEDVH